VGTQVLDTLRSTNRESPVSRGLDGHPTLPLESQNNRPSRESFVPVAQHSGKVHDLDAVGSRNQKANLGHTKTTPGASPFHTFVDRSGGSGKAILLNDSTLAKVASGGINPNRVPRNVDLDLVKTNA
jgi:hypothetical protein